MKKIENYILVIFLGGILSCKSGAIEPFNISVTDYNYSLAYAVKYELSDKDLTIIFRGELEDEQDSILFFTKDLPLNKLRKISQIDINELEELYSTPCVADGDIKVFQFNKDGILKRIQVNNFYQKDLSKAIELINNIVPEKFKMYHDKTDLLAKQKRCDIETKKAIKRKV